MKNLHTFEEFLNESAEGLLKPFKVLGKWDNHGEKVILSNDVEIKMRTKNLSSNKSLLKNAESQLFLGGYNDLSNIDVVEILAIITPKDLQNKGLGSSAMTQLIEAADINEIILYLEAIPIENTPLNSRELVKWYQKFGFQLMSYGKRPKMLRVPKK